MSWADLGVGQGGRGRPFSIEILYYFYRISSQKPEKYLIFLSRPLLSDISGSAPECFRDH